MSTVWELFRLQADERSDIFKKKKSKKFVLRIFWYLLICALVTVVLTLVFSRFVSVGLYVDSRVFAFLLLVTQALSFFVYLGNIFKTLYFNRDNELLISMPCSNNEMFFSKLLVIYFFDFLANALFSIPIFVTYAIVANAFSPFFLICMPLFLFILPLLPLALAALVSVPCVAIYNYLKTHPKLLVAATILLSAALFAVYMLLIFAIAGALDFSGAQNAIVTEIDNIISRVVYFSWIFKIAAEGMLFMSGWYWKLAVFIAIVAAIVALSILVVKHTYFKLARQCRETKMPSANRGRYKADSPYTSLLKKEFRTMFRSGGNLFSYYMFTILMPFIVLTYDKLFETITVNHVGTVMIAASHVLILGMLAMLSNISSASTISREGGNFYLSKVTPVDFKMQCLAKISFNAFITWTALLITAVISLIFTDIYPVYILCGTLAVMIAALGHIILSFMLDLRKPKLNWYDQTEIDKTSGTTKLSILLGMLIAFILFVVVFLFALTNYEGLPWGIIILISLVFTACVSIFARVKMKKYYERLEV